MTQHEIDQAVASATGETLAEIQQRGFCIADQLEVKFDPEPRSPRNSDDRPNSVSQMKYG